MTTLTTKSPTQEARETLKALSAEVLDLVHAGTFNSINDALMETMYKSGPHRQFNTFHQWNKTGFRVRTGEKPFMLWARPRDFDFFNHGTNTTEEGKYFPIVYLFSNAQVDPIKHTMNAEESTTISSRQLEPLPYD